MLDVDVPPPPAAPYTLLSVTHPVCHSYNGWDQLQFFTFLSSSSPKRDSKVQPGVKVGPKSPNSCLDSERSRPVPVRLRQRSLARCESARAPILLLKSLEPAANR